MINKQRQTFLYLFGLSALLFLLLASGTERGRAQSTAVVDPNLAIDEPCLEGDPYELNSLLAVLDGDNPPTAPVVINEYITVEYLGDGSVTDEAFEDNHIFQDETTDATENPNEPSIDDVRVGVIEMVTFDDVSNHIYKVSVTEDAMRAIHTCREEAGMTRGSEIVDDQLASEIGYRMFMPTVLDQDLAAGAPADIQGRPQGKESRILFNAQVKYPWRTIASMGRVTKLDGTAANPGCTGTLIGPRLMVTAAHCISDFGSSQFKGVRAAPARAGTIAPYGTATVDGNNRFRYFVHVDWLQGQGASKITDWGLVVLPENPFPTLNQWMGYAAVSGNVLANYRVYNRGYPTCASGNPTHPSPCQVGNMYGDLNDCDLGEYHSLDAQTGWNRNIRHSCATSAGQSGSALYIYLPTQQGNVPAVIGTHVGTGLCDYDADNNDSIDPDELCTEDDPWLLNVFRRHTPIELWIISLYRELYS